MSYETLTKEQRSLIPVYKEKYKNLILNTERANRPVAEKAFIDYYAHVGAPAPKIIWTESAFSAALLAAKLRLHPKGEELPVDEVLATLPNFDMSSLNSSVSEIKRQIIEKNQRKDLTTVYTSDSIPTGMIKLSDLEATRQHAQQGSFSAYWLAYATFIQNEVRKQKFPIIEIANTIAENCGIYFSFSKVLVVSEKPVKISVTNKVTADGEVLVPHCIDDMSIKFSDGTGVYSVMGNVGTTLLESIIKNRIESAGN